MHIPRSYAVLEDTFDNKAYTGTATSYGGNSNLERYYTFHPVSSINLALRSVRITQFKRMGYDWPSRQRSEKELDG